MQAILNFIGVAVSDWRASYAFYTETLGMASKLNATHGDWAMLGAGWDGYYAGEKSIVIELFDGGRVPVGKRWQWGINQGIRAVIHVAELDAAIAHLDACGLEHSPITSTLYGERITYTAPEGISWALATVKGRPVTQNWAKPFVGTVEIKAVDLPAQRRFYRDVLGMIEVATDDERGVIFQQRDAALPRLVIEAGASQPRQNPAAWAHDPVRAHPIFASVMTPDIHAVHASIQRANVPILRPLISHDSWGGTDIHIADADGNALQIVQYH